LSEELRDTVREAVSSQAPVRLKAVVRAVGWASSSFFHRRKQERRRPGPAPSVLDPALAETIRQLATSYPWWGYKRLAVIARRRGLGVSNRLVYRVLKAADLLQRPRPRSAELYQATRLFELLPSGPNELWQADVTYVHIPGHGWWYAVTVIDYFSRYLLALHLSPSHDAAAVMEAVDLARAKAERHHGRLTRPPFLVTDNGSSFIARRFRRYIEGSFSQVRTRYRTPQQLGLLERFHQTLKDEEVYWHVYSSPDEARQKLAAFHERYNVVRPHWALIPVEGGDPVTPEDVYCRGIAVQLPAWQGWARAAKAKLDALLRQDAEGTKAA
jgi:transposase InsO family protein